MIDLNTAPPHHGTQPPPARAAASFSDTLATFRAEIEAHGLRPGEIIPDGDLHRCPTEGKPNGQDGAYVLHLDSPASGWWQNHRTGESDTWAAARTEELSGAERRTLQQRIERDRAAREAAQAQRQAEAAQEALSILKAAPSCPADHPYLSTKRVRPAGDIRLGASGELLVAVQNQSGQIMSLQRIHPDGQKRFLTGGRKRGGFFPIPGTAEPLHIVEGLATGLSVHEATGCAVLVAFDAGNLFPVAEQARRNNPGQEIVVCGDDDRWAPGNPGRTKAEAAARAVGGRAVFPEFRAAAGNPTDWNDLHTREGIEAVRVQLEGAAGPPSGGLYGRVPLNAQDLCNVEPAPREWIFTGPGALPRGECGILAGQGGCGKTLLALQIGASVASGVDCLGGAFEFSAKGPVLMVLAEDDANEIARRLRRIQHLSGPLDLSDLHILPRGGDPQLVRRDSGRNIEPTEGFHQFRQLVATLRPVLVVVDSLSVTAGEAEVSNPDGQRVVSLFDQIRDAGDNASVVILGHVTKSSLGAKGGSGNKLTPEHVVDAALDPSAVRGPGALINGARWCMTVTLAPRAMRRKMGVDEGTSLVAYAIRKTNCGPGLDLAFLLNDGGHLCAHKSTVSTMEDFRPMILRILAEVGPVSRRDFCDDRTRRIRRQLEISRDGIRDIITRLIEDGEVEERTEGRKTLIKVRDEVRGTMCAEVRGEFTAHMQQLEMTDDAKCAAK